MRRFTIAVLAVLLSVGIASLLAGCAGEKKESDGKIPGGPSGAAYGDAIVEGSIGDVSGFISAVTSDQPSHAAAGFVFNGLVRYDKDLKLEGELAESWEVSKDGKKITFRLRKNVKWHDGAPFTSDDVLFTYRKMIDPKTPTAYAEDFKQVSRVSAPDPHTFIAEYDRPFAPALASWGMHILPKHLLDKYPDISKSPQNKRPVGTGPYRFLEWKTGEKVVFEENPDYFEGRPYISRVVVRVIPDSATMFLELKSGGIDYMGMTPVQFTRQTGTAEFKDSFNKYRYLSFGYTYLGFRLNHPFFSDRKVRQAISHAINKKEIIDGVLFGLGQEATGPYKPGTWAHNPDVKKFPFDAGKA
ncbi:MAG: ABC transporter substrate-binding protein, partial [Deltaproteobacteria bacterium]